MTAIDVYQPSCAFIWPLENILIEVCHSIIFFRLLWCYNVSSKTFFFFKFRKRIQKDNITFHENYTVSYREYRRYYFEPSMSVGNESDVVTIPNMLVLVSHSSSLFADLAKLIQSQFFIKFSLASVFSGCGSDDGKNALFISSDGQCHVQDFQRGTLPDEDGGRADVGLRQQAGQFPQ